MKPLIRPAIGAALGLLVTSEAFAWGAVGGPHGGTAYRGTMGGAAVHGPAGGAAYRPPGGGGIIDLRPLARATDLHRRVPIIQVPQPQPA